MLLFIDQEPVLNPGFTMDATSLCAAISSQDNTASFWSSGKSCHEILYPPFNRETNFVVIRQHQTRVNFSYMMLCFTNHDDSHRHCFALTLPAKLKHRSTLSGKRKKVFFKILIDVVAYSAVKP
jgi:hypothetical protein